MSESKTEKKLWKDDNLVKVRVSWAEKEHQGTEWSVGHNGLQKGPYPDRSIVILPRGHVESLRNAQYFETVPEIKDDNEHFKQIRKPRFFIEEIRDDADLTPEEIAAEKVLG